MWFRQKKLRGHSTRPGACKEESYFWSANQFCSPNGKSKENEPLQRLPARQARGSRVGNGRDGYRKLSLVGVFVAFSSKSNERKSRRGGKSGGQHRKPQITNVRPSFSRSTSKAESRNSIKPTSTSRRGPLRPIFLAAFLPSDQAQNYLKRDTFGSFGTAMGMGYGISSGLH